MELFIWWVLMLIIGTSQPASSSHKLTWADVQPMLPACISIAGGMVMIQVTYKVARWLVQVAVAVEQWRARRTKTK